MKDFASIIGFLLVAILFAMSMEGGEGITTRDYETVPGTGFFASDDTVESSDTPSPEEIESRIEEIKEEIGNLKMEERDAKLRSPRSPYEGQVTLGQGNAYSEQWSEEHLTLRANGNNPNAIDITGWTLESYVTKERTKIPSGDRVVERIKKPVLERILLRPGEDAYLITGRSPVAVSFRENICTGYFDEKKDFSPGLSHQCPDPDDDMKIFSNVSYANDACYDFVERLSSCRVPDEEIVKEADISNACENFITGALTYDGCVKNHKLDTDFDENASWYVYLGRTRDLWRSEREIIRLLDAQGRVVDVIEY